MYFILTPEDAEALYQAEPQGEWIDFFWLSEVRQFWGKPNGYDDHPTIGRMVVGGTINMTREQAYTAALRMMESRLSREKIVPFQLSGEDGKDEIPF